MERLLRRLRVRESLLIDVRHGLPPQLAVGCLGVDFDDLREGSEAPKVLTIVVNSAEAGSKIMFYSRELLETLSIDGQHFRQVKIMVARGQQHQARERSATAEPPVPRLKSWQQILNEHPEEHPIRAALRRLSQRVERLESVDRNRAGVIDGDGI